MSDYFDEPSIIIPVDLSRDGWRNLEPVELLSSTDVVLLGLYPIKDQVSLSQAREQLGEKAEKRLRTLCQRFENVGVEPDCELVFSEDFSDAIDRVAVEKGCNGILTWNQKMVFDRIGVLVKCEHGIDHVINATAWLMIDQDQEMDLVHFLETGVDDETYQERKTSLESSLDYLCDRGIDRDRLNLRMEIVEDPQDAMVKAADEYDALIMGETEQTVASVIFGRQHELIQQASQGPVLIVRNPEDH